MVPLEIFYDGLTNGSRIMVDTAANGTFLTLTYTAARNLLDQITTNKVKRSKRSTTKAGVLEVDKYATLEARCAQLEHMM